MAPVAHPGHNVKPVDTGWSHTSIYWVGGQDQPLSRPSGVSLGMQARGHAVEEPGDTKDDAKGLGDIWVVSEGLRAIQGQVHDFNELTLLSQASAGAAPMGVGHLCVEHRLDGASQSHARPVGPDSIC